MKSAVEASGDSGRATFVYGHLWPFVAEVGLAGARVLPPVWRASVGSDAASAHSPGASMRLWPPRRKGGEGRSAAARSDAVVLRQRRRSSQGRVPPPAGPASETDALGGQRPLIGVHLLGVSVQAAERFSGAACLGVYVRCGFWISGLRCRFKLCTHPFIHFLCRVSEELWSAIEIKVVQKKARLWR